MEGRKERRKEGRKNYITPREKSFLTIIKPFSPTDLRDFSITGGPTKVQRLLNTDFRRQTLTECSAHLSLACFWPQCELPYTCVLGVNLSHDAERD